MTNVEREEARAKQLLFDLGYVVIPRERHRILTVDRAVSVDLLKALSAENLDSFHKHCADSVGREIGSELMRVGAITKEDLGRDRRPYSIQRWRYQAGVIIPRSNSFEST